MLYFCVQFQIVNADDLSVEVNHCKWNYLEFYFTAVFFFDFKDKLSRVSTGKRYVAEQRTAYYVRVCLIQGSNRI